MERAERDGKRWGVDDRHTKLSARVTWNLLGLGIPVLVALVAVPRLVAGMGTARFGVLTLAWALIGYFSVFDMGLGRALTRSISAQLAVGQHASLSRLITTATTLMTSLGVALATMLALAGPVLLTRWIRVPQTLQAEVTQTIIILAATVPCVLLSTAYRGIIEAFGRFDWSNEIRLPIGILNFLAPLAVLEYSSNLALIVSSLALSRILSWYAYRFASRRLVHVPLFAFRLDREWIRPLVVFSGWATISALIGPLMLYLDRFAIGTVASLSAVAYYATPYDILNRLGLIPSAVIDAIFPMMSSALVADRRAAGILHYHGMLAIVFFMTPPIAAAALYAEEGLSFWLGTTFAEQGAPVARWLALGVLFNAVARVALNTLYADGRASAVAKLHLLELLPYLFLLATLGMRFGIQGVAAAWTVRVLADMCALQLLSGHLFHGFTSLFANWALLATITAITVGGLLVSRPGVKPAILLVICISSISGLAWLYRRGYSRVFTAALRA